MTDTIRLRSRAGLLAATAIVLVAAHGTAFAQDATNPQRPVTSQDQPGTQGPPSAAQQPGATNGVDPLVSSKTDDASAGPASTSDIIVTGFRASLQSALQNKRSSDLPIESIAPEDIGKFPDQNVAESLQRLQAFRSIARKARAPRC